MRYISGWVESLPLTDMRYINSRVRSLVYKRESFFISGRRILMESGFYVISDNFFRDFPEPNLKGNKCEHRPHYYALKDKNTGLYWMIPMSSRIDKYRRIIEIRESKNKRCDTLHIAKLDND